MVEQVYAELTDLFTNSLREWLTIDQVAQRFQDMESRHGGLIQEFKEAGGNIRNLLPLLQQLLGQGVSILDLASILEIWIEYPEEQRLSKMAEQLTEGERW